MTEITEDKAIELALTPHLITDALTCNTVISFLNAKISDMALAEWEAELEANVHQVHLLHATGKTNALATAEWHISEPFKKWRELKLELQKFRAYRNSLRSREEELKNQPHQRPYGDISKFTMP